MARKIEYPITFYGIESHGKTTALSRRAELYGGKYGVVFHCDVEGTYNQEKTVHIGKNCLGKLCYGKVNCQRLHQEARCLRQLHHPNVITCHGIFAVQSPLYQLVLLMDYFDQRILDVLEPLDDIAAHRTIPWMINQLLEAIRYIHNEQIDGRIRVHGNLNMNSIRVKEHLKRLALCDFAIASQETRSPTSFDYLSPELKKRITPIPLPESGAGQFVDIMCCGLVIKGMCLRKENVSPTDVVQPSEMNDLVNRCLRESHPVTIDELIDNWGEVEEKYHSVQREIPITPYGSQEGNYRFLSTLEKWPLSGIYGYHNRRLWRCYAAGNNGKKALSTVFFDNMVWDAWEKMRDEAEFLMSLSHPNILRCYGLYQFSQPDNRLMMITENVPNETLNFVLSRYEYETAASKKFLVSLGDQLLSAVSYIHTSTLKYHGDLKPCSLFVDRCRGRLVLCGPRNLNCAFQEPLHERIRTDVDACFAYLMKIMFGLCDSTPTKLIHLYMFEKESPRTLGELKNDWENCTKTQIDREIIGMEEKSFSLMATYLAEKEKINLSKTCRLMNLGIERQVKTPRRREQFSGATSTSDKIKAPMDSGMGDGKAISREQGGGTSERTFEDSLRLPPILAKLQDNARAHSMVNRYHQPRTATNDDDSSDDEHAERTLECQVTQLLISILSNEGKIGLEPTDVHERNVNSEFRLRAARRLTQRNLQQRHSVGRCNNPKRLHGVDRLSDKPQLVLHGLAVRDGSKSELGHSPTTDNRLGQQRSNDDDDLPNLSSEHVTLIGKQLEEVVDQMDKFLEEARTELIEIVAGQPVEKACRLLTKEKPASLKNKLLLLTTDGQNRLWEECLNVSNCTLPTVASRSLNQLRQYAEKEVEVHLKAAEENLIEVVIKEVVDQVNEFHVQVETEYREKVSTQPKQLALQLLEEDAETRFLETSLREIIKTAERKMGKEFGEDLMKRVRSELEKLEKRSKKKLPELLEKIEQEVLAQDQAPGPSFLH